MIAGGLQVTSEVGEDVAQAIEGGLRAFNERHDGPDPTKPLWVVRRDDAGDIVGGLQAHTMWDWCSIAMLWVREDHRGRGVGTELLEAAEAAAIERGCRKFQLVTLSYQAPGFYRRFGYSEVGRIDDCPPGHAYIWMSKILPA